jgi:hypothetical protein
MGWLELRHDAFYLIGSAVLQSVCECVCVCVCGLQINQESKTFLFISVQNVNGTNTANMNAPWCHKHIQICKQMPEGKNIYFLLNR